MAAKNSRKNAKKPLRFPLKRGIVGYKNSSVMKGWEKLPGLSFMSGRFAPGGRERMSRKAVNKNQIVKTVWELAAPIADQLGLVLWDVLFLKEGATWSLRIVIDREGGVDMDACEAMSRALDPKLDEADPIDQSYTLEVWSAGLDRDLTRDFHFESSLGMPVTIGLFTPLNGEKEPVMTLRAFSAKTITAVDGDGNEHEFIRSQLRFVRRKDEISFD